MKKFWKILLTIIIILLLISIVFWKWIYIENYYYLHNKPRGTGPYAQICRPGYIANIKSCMCSGNLEWSSTTAEGQYVCDFKDKEMMYSFDMPLNMVSNRSIFKVCAITIISGVNNVHDQAAMYNTDVRDVRYRFTGNINIYPKSCVDNESDLQVNTGNIKKRQITEKDGYYIVSFGDISSGMTEEDITNLDNAYKLIVDTFKLK